MTKKTRSYHSHVRFTLIEMLMVIGIMVILMAFFAPAYVKARSYAAAVKCTANIRQLAAANIMYAQDSHDKLFVPSSIKGTEILWYGQFDKPDPGTLDQYGLALYLSEAHRECPSVVFVEGNDKNKDYGGAYGYSVEIGAFETGDPPAYVGQATRPAKTIMFSDSASESGEDYAMEPHLYSPDGERRGEATMHFRHNDLASVAWVDGHATRNGPVSISKNERKTIGWFGGTDTLTIHKDFFRVTR